MRATRCHTATCADISPRNKPTDKAETAAQGTQRRLPAAIMKAERTPTASAFCNTLWLSALQKAVF